MNLQPIWEHSKTEGIDRMVLVVLVDSAGDDCYTPPLSVPVIAAKSGVHRRTVQKVLRRLEELGEVRTLPGPSNNAGNLYRVLIGEKQGRGEETPPPGGRRGSPSGRPSAALILPDSHAWLSPERLAHRRNGAA